MSLVLAISMLLLGAEQTPGWSPRQVQLIKLSNVILETETPAFLNHCAIRDGRTRHEAGVEKLKTLTPKLEQELGDWAVYEIFVQRAPVILPSVMPPKTCKTLKNYDPAKEELMIKFEQAVSALAEGVENS